MPMFYEMAASLIIAAAFFMQRLTGFGAAVLATPLLVFFLEPHDAVVLMMVYQNAFAMLLIGKTWRRLFDERLRVFMVLFVPGVLIGAYLLPQMPGVFVRRAMGVASLLAWSSMLQARPCVSVCSALLTLSLIFRIMVSPTPAIPDRRSRTGRSIRPRPRRPR